MRGGVKQPFVPTEADKRRAQALAFARRANGLSQKGLGKLIGRSMRTIRRWEIPNRGLTAHYLDRLREVLGPFDSAPSALPAAPAEAFTSEPQPPWPDLGRALRGAREKAGLTQEAVAEAAGVSRVTLCKYEDGWATKLDELREISAALGMRLQVALWPRVHAAEPPSDSSSSSLPPKGLG